MEKVMSAAKVIAESVRSKGGRALIVGGAVRDMVLGAPAKDLDMEVFGVAPDALLDLAASLGTVDVCGASFAVVKVTLEVGGERVHVDLSLPRLESKSGTGHRGFTVEGRPGLSVVEAATRRDFTMNAMSFDVLSGELLDPFGGQDDLSAGILRATGEKFKEDPLRVLRGMQFASRFNLTMDSDTVYMCREIGDSFCELSPERVCTEWRKWANGAHPSRGLELLGDTRWLAHFPEIHMMLGVPQDPKRHPEGDVWTHTSLVVDRAAKAGAGDAVVFAALLHDTGKAQTTVVGASGRLTSQGHAQWSEALAREFMTRMRMPVSLTAKVTKLAGAHMWHTGGMSARAVRRWSRRVRPASMGELVQLVECDSLGRGKDSTLPSEVVRFRELVEGAGVAKEPVRGLLGGRHLLALGMTEGPEVGQVLREAMEQQIEQGWSTVDEALEWARGRV